MKSEYLITFDAQEKLCTTVEKFRSLLVAHSSISFSKKEQSFSYNGVIFPYILAQGTLTDNSIYYDLTIECTDENQHEDYKSLLKEIRKVCTKTSGRNIIILHDGVGEEYCQKGYPIIYRTENLMRKREFNFEVQFPIKNQAAFRSSSKTTCGCLNPKHLRGLKFSRFS
ncbi:hypothetical protein ACET70_20345, partial [Aeromonas caviae]|uniref:hypothetical protein n=1 Tax=Aeromonas caviae TaxID=648 RepID=UPI0038D08929